MWDYIFYPLKFVFQYRYINAVAKYYLHDRIKPLAKAFFQYVSFNFRTLPVASTISLDCICDPSGVREVVRPELLSMFCAPELQIIVSGATDGISVTDLRAHAQYTGGYSALDRNIKWFWATVEELTEEGSSPAMIDPRISHNVFY